MKLLRQLKQKSMSLVPVTEQVYVHSKLMIVDDRYVIIGSANINDRSMLGDRDTEIAVLIEDPVDVISSRMHDSPFLVSRFAHQLRVALWCEHLGLDESKAEDRAKVADPLSAETWARWRETSSHNTALFHSLFPHIPDDSIQSLDILAALEDAFKDKHHLEEGRARAVLSKVRGHLVDFPLHFLAHTNLSPDYTDLSMMVVDVEVFT